MTAVPFDTLKFATRLQAGGFSPEQARAAAEAFAEASGQELSTKGDIGLLRQDLQILERDLKIWFGKMLAWHLATMVGLVGAAVAIVKLM